MNIKTLIEKLHAEETRLLKRREEANSSFENQSLDGSIMTVRKIRSWIK